MSDETGVFVSQLDRKIHQMWHDGETREAALAEARDRLLGFGGAKRYMQHPLTAWLFRGPTERSAQSAVRDAYGPQGCERPDLPPCPSPRDTGDPKENER